MPLPFPGIDPYLEGYLWPDVHMEIDLLRRGARPLNHSRLSETVHLVTVVRAQRGAVEVWPIRLQDPLPTIPIPLKSPDADVSLDPGEAIAAIYEEAAYDLSLDYRQLPPPKLSQIDCQRVDDSLNKIRGLE